VPNDRYEDCLIDHAPLLLHKLSTLNFSAMVD